MLKLNNIGAPRGANRDNKRRGRGIGSGQGKTGGRGHKGQKARSGGGVRPGFEGGQNPLIKKLPQKRGFVNPFRVEYAIINVGTLNSFEAGTEITPEFLVEHNLIKNTKAPVKILATGELDRALTVKAKRFTVAAKNKIEAAGGKVEEI